MKIARSSINFTVSLDYKVPTLEEKRDWKRKVINRILYFGYLSEIRVKGKNVVNISLIPRGSQTQINDKELGTILEKILEEEKPTETCLEKENNITTVYNIYRIENGILKIEAGYTDYKNKQEALEAIKKNEKTYVYNLVILESIRRQ